MVEAEVSFKKEEWETMDALVNDHFNRSAPIVHNAVKCGLVTESPISKAVFHEETSLSLRQDGPMFTMAAVPLPIRKLTIPGDADLGSMEAALEMGRQVEREFKRGLMRLDPPICKRSEAIKKLYSLNYYGPYMMVHVSMADAKYLVQTTKDVMDIIVGLHPTLVIWDGKLELWSVMVPRFRRDSNGNTGVVRIV